MTHFERLHQLAIRHHKQAVEAFHATHKHAKRILRKHKVVLHKIRHHAVRTGAVASLSAGILAAPALAASEPIRPPPIPNNVLQAEMIADHTEATGQQQLAAIPVNENATGPDVALANKNLSFEDQLRTIAPDYAENLTGGQETQVMQLVKDFYGIDVAPTTPDSKFRLNVTHGVIAGEQHLPLYPGDTLANHTSDPTAQATGMVPGLPAWGYFANSKAQVTQLDIERERYYIAAQTFLAPGWDQNVNAMYSEFKYAKVLLFMPDGSAVVACIGDAGPSPRLTSVIEEGRHTRRFGGSNEVLIALGLGKKRVGGVYVFFVQDPENKIPLGPISFK